MTNFGTQIKHGTCRGGSRYNSQSTTKSNAVSINVDLFYISDLFHTACASALRYVSAKRHQPVLTKCQGSPRMQCRCPDTAAVVQTNERSTTQILLQPRSSTVSILQCSTYSAGFSFSLKGPTHGKTVCATQTDAQTVWPCVVWFDCLYKSLTVCTRV